MQKGKTYFYIPPYCCDMFGDLYDDTCNLICHPDGGFSGIGDGSCPDIEIKKETLVWQDDRTK